MKAAAVFPAKKSVGVVDFDPPKLSTPRDMKLRMLQVGVCGTDREICSFVYGTPPPGFEYLVLGHESIGEVVEIGPEVAGFQVGDLVIPMVRRPCNHPECFACRAGRPDFCYTGDYTERGIKERHGFMTELVVDEEKYMNKVPKELREVAVLIEPLTIAEKAMLQINVVQQRLPWGRPNSPGKGGLYCHKAVVLGAGPVGLLGAMALVNAGFETWVYSRDPAPSRATDIVKAIGAKYISSTASNVDQMAAEVGNIDVVYEATGASQLAFDVLRVLGTNGLFVLTGVPGRHGPVEVDTDLIMRNLVLKNQDVLGTVNAGKDAFQNAIRDLGAFYASWPDAVKSLITGRYPLEEFEQPIHSSEGIKNIIQIAKPS